MEATARGTARQGWLAAGCFVFVVAAVAVEIAAGAASAGRAPSWARLLIPLSWPTSVRVLWWLAVASAALGYRLALHSLGFRQRPTVVALSTVPFVVFAGGIAAGAEWATWH